MDNIFGQKPVPGGLRRSAKKFPQWGGFNNVGYPTINQYNSNAIKTKNPVYFYTGFFVRLRESYGG
jgi:hypothetical protein